MQTDRSANATLDQEVKQKNQAWKTRVQTVGERFKRWATLEYTSSNRDLQPEAPRKRRFQWVADSTSRVRTRLTREGYQFVFLLTFGLTAAIIQNVNLLVLLSGSLGGMVLLQWRLCSRTLSRLSLQRNLPVLIEARKAFPVDIIVENPKRWLGCWFVVVRETIRARRSNTFGSNENQSIYINVDFVAPSSSANVSCVCTCEHPGQYTFLRSEMSTRFPFSLMRGIRTVDNEADFLVHPTFGKLEKNWRGAIELPRIGERHRRLASSGGDGEFFGLRDYRSGDPMRLIHWRSSAKGEGLIVRQLERQENYQLAILVDLTQPKLDSISGPRDTAKDRINEMAEIGLELSVTMIQEILSMRAGDISFAIADGRANNSFHISSHSQFSALLSRLSTTRAVEKSNFLQVANQVFVNNPIGNPVLVISLRSRESSEIDRRMLQNDQTYRTANLRWVNLQTGEWSQYFKRGGKTA